ncbi:hypothetical protein D9M68_81980 [compost metagenome]
MYVSYRVVPRVEVVSSGVYRPGALVIAYDDDVPLNELVCDGAKPVGDYDEAKVVAEILALRVRSRVEKSNQQIDIRLPAIQAMLHRIAATSHPDPAEQIPPLDLDTTQYANPLRRRM